MDKSLSYIEISRQNLVSNIKVFRRFIPKGTLISAVIKANAYGHGQNEVAKVLEPHADYFQVDDLQELSLLRKVTKKPVLVLGYVAKKELEQALKLGAILAIYDLERLKLINEIAHRLKTKAKLHIKIDACIGRQGLLICDVKNFLSKAKAMKNIECEAIYSHFANIEDTDNNVHALKQMTTFNQAFQICDTCGFEKIKKHFSSTAGLLLYEKEIIKSQIVRPGIGLYGMWPSENLKRSFSQKLNLRPVLRWVTHIAQMKVLPKNYTVGYGLTYKTKRPTKVAVIPQGYSDGYDRKLSNCGEVLVGGERCPVLGRVAMNMFVVDISKTKNARPEDEVVLLGSQGNDAITAEAIAEKIDTINYEVTARINPLLPRIVVN